MCANESPVVRYTLARLGVFLAAAAVLFVVPIGLHPLLRLAIALLISAGLSLFLFRGLRDQVAEQLAAGARRRSEEKARLRAALAGDTPDDHDDR